jgi:hypothetical protein
MPYSYYPAGCHLMKNEISTFYKISSLVMAAHLESLQNVTEK